MLPYSFVYPGVLPCISFDQVLKVANLVNINMQAELKQSVTLLVEQ